MNEIDPNSAEYIVVRVSRDYPHQVPNDLDGRWYKRSDIPKPLKNPAAIPIETRATALPLEQFETREDGAIAQVYLLN